MIRVCLSLRGVASLTCWTAYIHLVLLEWLQTHGLQSLWFRLDCVTQQWGHSMSYVQLQKGHVLRAFLSCRSCHQQKRTLSSSRVCGGLFLANQKYVYSPWKEHVWWLLCVGWFTPSPVLVFCPPSTSTFQCCWHWKCRAWLHQARYMYNVTCYTVAYMCLLVSHSWWSTDWQSFTYPNAS